MAFFQRDEKMKAGILGTALAAASAIAIVGVRYCPVPWAPALFAMALLTIFGAWAATRDGTKIVMANFAALVLALAIVEGIPRL